MKPIIYLVHGWASSIPTEPVLLKLKKSLEQDGYEVKALNFPLAKFPIVWLWTWRLKQVVQNDKPAIFVGHSIGCQAILRYLMKTKSQPKLLNLILIAPWFKLDNQVKVKFRAKYGLLARLIMWSWTREIDFRLIKNKTQKIIALLSRDDQTVPLDINREILNNNLQAEVLVYEKAGHFSRYDEIDITADLLLMIKKVV